MEADTMYGLTREECQRAFDESDETNTAKLHGINKARWAAYNAAELTASDARDSCAPAPVDHAAQAALENSEVSGEAFEAAYDEIFQTVDALMTNYTATEAAKKIARLKAELF